MIFLDTNILLYAICPGRDERAKAEIAREILRRDDVALWTHNMKQLLDFYWRYRQFYDPLPHQLPLHFQLH